MGEPGMTVKTASLLDDRLDAVAATARAVFITRFVVGAGAALLTAWIFWPMLGAAWFALFAEPSSPPVTLPARCAGAGR